jgi:hypothetical protein
MSPPPPTFDFLFPARPCSVGLDTVNEGGKMDPFSQSTYEPTAHSEILRHYCQNGMTDHCLKQILNILLEE